MTLFYCSVKVRLHPHQQVYTYVQIVYLSRVRYKIITKYIVLHLPQYLFQIQMNYKVTGQPEF